MTAAGIEIVVDSGRGTLHPKAYTKVLLEACSALEEIDRAAAPGRNVGRLAWVIEEMSVNGIHRAVIGPREIPSKRDEASVSVVALGLVKGVGILNQAPEIPPLFSERTVRRVSDMGKATKERPPTVHLRTRKTEAIVDPETVEHAQKAVHVDQRSFGSVQGRLLTLSHSKTGSIIRAIVVMQRDRRVVTVRAHDDQAEQLREAWGRDVLIGGELLRNSVGQPIRIEMTELRILPSREPVSARDIFGVAPNYTGEMTTEEFISHARRG